MSYTPKPIPVRRTMRGDLEQACLEGETPDGWITELGFGGHEYVQEWPTYATAVEGVRLLERIEAGLPGEETATNPPPAKDDVAK